MFFIYFRKIVIQIKNINYFRKNFIPFAIVACRLHLCRIMRTEALAEETQSNCIYCGAPIYGRTDKKFCSLACKNLYHYKQVEKSVNIRNRIITSLNVNYRILEKIIDASVASVELRVLEDMGFKPSYITGIRRTRGRYDEYACFDIRYCQTANRLFNIRKCPDF